MSALVDTHAFLWYVTGDKRLSKAALRAMETTGEWWLSAASVWELSIKSSLDRLVLPAPAPDYIGSKVRDGLRVLPVEWTHAAAVERMPFHHRDPFDRLIAAQAQVERIPIVTRDRLFRKYGVETIW